jgi:pimeloyl-ACP methyl ester carboxylesterase
VSTTGAPLDELEALGMSEVELAPGLRHLEIFTTKGILTLLWHGPRDAEAVALLGGGAMGGLLGPGRALYHELGVRLADDHRIGTVRVDWRTPNHLPRCTMDLCATADLAVRAGARRFVTVGHSFGGAVAVQAGAALPSYVRGVCTLSTQSAGCEVAGMLAPRPLLLLHGDDDTILPPETSSVVRRLAGGHGEVVLLPGAGHGLVEAHDVVRDRLLAWIPEVLTA